MLRLKRKPSKQIHLVARLFTLVIFSILRGHGNYYLGLVGDLCLISFVGISGFVFLIHLSSNKGIPAFVRNVIVAFGFASLFYFVGMISTQQFNHPSIAAYRATQLLAVGIVICAFYYCGSAYDSQQLINQITKVSTRMLVLFSFITIGISVLFSSAREAGFTNENTIGLWLATFALFPLASSHGGLRKWGPVLLAMFAILSTGSRTSLGAIVCGLTVYACWRPIRSNPILLWGCWVLVFVFAYFTIYLLSGQLDFADLGELNQMSRDYSGKNFLSGRDRLWPLAIHLIEEKPWFGWGGGTNISRRIYQFSSEHNMYLQTLLQVGFSGMLAIVVAMSTVWAGFGKLSNPDNIRFVSVGAAIFISVTMCQNFEISLFQTNLGLSMPMWAMAGLVIGAGQSENQRQQPEFARLGEFERSPFRRHV